MLRLRKISCIVEVELLENHQSLYKIGGVDVKIEDNWLHCSDETQGNHQF